jgi:hypothetical protein
MRVPGEAVNQRSRRGRCCLGEERLRLPPKACRPMARGEQGLVGATVRGVAGAEWRLMRQEQGPMAVIGGKGGGADGPGPQGG